MSSPDRAAAFTLSSERHVAFGALITLRLAGQPERRFTRQEAAIVARGLQALATGASREPQIYMSPVASDYDLEARLIGDNLAVTLEGAPSAVLALPEAFALIAELKRAAGVE
jgi:hypothetical protein